MKTTIDIADGLFQQARMAAERDGTTLRALVEEGLRLALERRDRPAPPFKLRDASFRGEGLQAGLSWDLPRSLAYDDPE